jgi:hypothetical protein
MDDDEALYEEELDRAVFDLRECASFDALMIALGEPHPPTVIASIGRLEDNEYFDHATAERLCRVGDRSEVSVERGLPVPHFQDGDWRFTTTTSDALARQLTDGSTGNILLIGAPSIFCALIRALARASPVTAVDASFRTVDALNNLARNGGFGDRFAAFHVDVARGDPLPLTADRVFMDPPWYEHFVDHFLWYASAHCRPGGHVTCVFPGKLTRPGVQRERQRQIDLAKTFALRFVRCDEKAVRYEMPSFEANALSSLNLTVASQWRSGDLVVFEKTGDTCATRPTVLPPAAWGEFTYEAVRFRTHPSATISSFNPIPLALKGVPFNEGRQSLSGLPNIYPSTSRRTPGFSLIRIMTSGQEAFACENTALFLVIGRSLEVGGDPCAAASEYEGRRLNEDEVAMVLRTVLEIERIASRENQRVIH